MAAPADPTMTPAAGLVNAGTDVEIDAVVDVSFYYTLGGETPGPTSKLYASGAFDDLLDKGGDNLNIKVVAYNDADTTFAEPSDVVEFQYRALSLGGAVSATAPALVDTGTGQGGAVCSGIAVTGSDGASAGIARLGGTAGTDVKIETGDGIGV
jgi:hypothetical protein